MNLSPLEDAVRDDTIRFATTRPPDSPFATLDRRVVLTGPPELIAHLSAPDVGTLDALVRLLDDPQRSWAAQVALAALTGREGKIVESAAAEPGRWRETLGKTSRERWQSWLRDAKPKLTWDAAVHTFSGVE